MSDNNYLREEAEYLRKRAWDFVSKLEELEREVRLLPKEDIDTKKRQSLQIRIDNTLRLLDNYENEYKAMCEEAGIPAEIIGTGISNYDIAPSVSRNVKKDQKLDLPPLFLVPSRNPNFVGRQDKILEFIEQVLQEGPLAIYGFKGMGGIGKTEIAKEACHLFYETWKDEPDLPGYLTDILSQKKGGFFRDGIFWIRFHTEQQTPKTLTDELISQLIEQSPKVGKEIQDLDMLADVLEGKDMLMVLDNVEQNLRTFNYVLERFKGRFTLVTTSRIAIPGIKSIDMNVFTDEDAESLFLRYMDNPQLTGKEQENVRELCALLGQHPLFIRNTASRMKAGIVDLKELLKKYRKNPILRFDKDSKDSSIDQHYIDVRSCFMTSFNSLEEKQKQIFLHTALFNNPFTLNILRELLGNIDETELGYIVNRFERLSLVNCLYGGKGQEKKYELHPLIREFALDLLMQEVNKKAQPGRKEAIEIFLKDLHEKKGENILPEQIKKDPSLVKQALEAVQYCDQMFEFSLVLNLFKVLDGPLTSLSYSGDRLSLYNLAKRAAVVALPDDGSLGTYLNELDCIKKRSGSLKK